MCRFVAAPIDQDWQMTVAQRTQLAWTRCVPTTALLPRHPKEKTMQKITPFLWYAKEAEEAAAFCASIFPDSHVRRVTAMPSESPSGPPGSVKVVEFVLFGQPFIAMSAGPLDPFNHAVSFVVNCDDQAELDRYWNALLEGGSAEQCGWLKDRFGLSWQIIPTVLGEMMANPDRARAKRASDAMMTMVKIDIAALQAAFAGTASALRK
jgi:predicted 3-demethylubiquinone-9 3-methyltransferase (glyoxalase superfamily)